MRCAVEVCDRGGVPGPKGCGAKRSVLEETFVIICLQRLCSQSSKSGTAAPQNPIDSNPISQYFEIGRQTAAAGPELVWKIYEAYKKSDGKETNTKKTRNGYHH
uniref:Uncharacterized protein n=1 Tax=Lutzomyia longipalpis TaxID=7200 RepID=A0A1B0CX72_LUTLO